MARAIETGMQSMWQIRDLCPNCPLREGGQRDPDFLQLKHYRVEDKGVVTPISFTTPDGQSREIDVPGIPKPESVKSAVDGCEEPEVFEDKIVCGAIAQLSRRK
jgi:hypothetical protein